MTGKRELIVQAALDVIAESGLGSFTQPRVARRAGVRQSHLTYYFPTRDDLLAVVADEAVRRRIATLREATAGARDPREAIAGVARVLASPGQTRVLMALTEAADQNEVVRASFGVLAQGVGAVSASLLQMVGAEADAASLALLQATSTGIAVIALARGETAAAATEGLLNDLLDRVMVPLSAWSRTVLDSAMDAVVVIDGQGQVVYWNPAAESMFGRSWVEVAGRELAELIIPPELRGRHRQALHASRLGKPGSILDRRIEVTGQRSDGSLFPVELTITRTDRGETQLFTGYLRDITQRQRMLDELRDSRTRMLEVSDRTRREIERDLHDGAQQQLVGAAMAVAQARDSLAGDPAVAGALLDRAGAVLVEAITGIREIARGVLPDVLGERGLQPALAELGRRSPIPVRIDTVSGRWPATVEITLYFLAAEALTNAAKHGAHTAQLHLHTEPGQMVDGGGSGDGRGGGLVIVCTIADDGPGGADPSRGTGLQGLRDRVTAVDGTLEIDSPAGQGTTVTGRIQIAQPGDEQRQDQREDR